MAAQSCRPRRIEIVLAALVAVAIASPAGATPPTIQHFTATRSDLNLITLDWQVSGGDSSNLLYIYDDIGFRAQACRTLPQPPGCSTTKRVTNGGVYRYTLSVRNAALEFATQTVEITVLDLPAPASQTANVDVDMLNVQQQSIWWQHAPSSAGFVRIYGTAPFAPPIADNQPTTGTYPVPASALAIGRNIYTIQYCERPPSNSNVPALCSDGVPFVFNVRPAHFAGDYRQFVPAGQSLTLSWSGSGNWWFVEAPSLNIGTWVTQPTYTVPASALTQGVHQFKVTSCIFGGRCSNRFDIYAPQAGVVTFTVGFQSVNQGTVVGNLAPSSGGTAIPLTAPRTGTFYPIVPSGSTVAANANVAAVITEDKDFKQVIVGQQQSLATWSSRTWSTDFTSAYYDTQARPTTGDALDVTFDSAGGIWQLGEFSYGIAHVAGGALTHHDVPTARAWNPSSGLYERVTPFGSGLSGNPRNVAYTELGERVIDTGSAVWFTQGGGLFFTGVANYSRIVRFDRNGVDSAATPDDDRMCAIHVPGDNAAVIGIASDGQRIWFLESSRKVLGWLDPATFAWPCNNFLDYGNAQAVQAAETANRCTSPTQQGCIHEIALPASAGFPAHVVVDATDGYVWFSTFANFGSGNVVGRYPLAGGNVETFPLPDSIGTTLAHGFPWQIRVDAEAVYLNEYGDNDLIRFDKHGSSCTALVNGQNPCMKEIHVPVRSPDVAMHSIDLVGTRLWFTLANEAGGAVDRSASTFGYVDVAAWKAGAPTGVLYIGLETLGDLSAGRYHSFRGIDVTPQGQVALADMRTDEVIRLDPHP